MSNRFMPSRESISDRLIGIVMLPLAVPIMIVFVISGIGMYFYDKWNDGIGH
jgi:hypothetical protein